MTTFRSVLSCLVTLSFFSYTAAARAAAPSDAAAARAAAPSDAPLENTVNAHSEGAASKRQHHGLYLRSHLGAGYRTASARMPADKMTLSGGGVAYGVAAGGTVARNVVVYGEILSEVASNPSVSSAEGSTTANGTTMNFVAIGPGVAYYIMPANVHLGLSVVVTKLSLDTYSSAAAQTEWGFGGAVRAGKDFWLNDSVGIGVMSQLTLARMKDSESVSGGTPVWNTTMATLAVEFTYH